MRCILTMLVMLPLLVTAAESAGSLTLDPAEMERARRQVFGGAGISATPAAAPAPANPIVPAQASEVERWQAAFASAGTDLMPVLLMALLQDMNPSVPMAANAEAYAEALALHRKAAAGNTQACILLAEAFRAGRLNSGLKLPHSEQLAEFVLFRGGAVFP